MLTELEFSLSREDGTLLPFDIETKISVEAERALLTAFAPAVSAYEDCGLPCEVAGFTVDRLEKHISDTKPPIPWLNELVMLENMGKARTGVLKVATDRLRKLQQGLDDAFHVLPEAIEPFCLSYADDNGEPVTILGDTISQKFWKMCITPTPMGYGIAKFDLPVLMMDSARKGIVPLRKFDFKRRSGYLDIHEERFKTYGSGGSQSLRSVALALGFTRDGDDPLKNGGADVAESIRRGDTDAVVAHCETDVRRLLYVHQYWNGLFY